MITTALKSSNLRTASYDPSTARLVVAFHSDAVYEYAQVPLPVFLRLLKADSHGSYFAGNIRNVYRYRRLK